MTRSIGSENKFEAHIGARNLKESGLKDTGLDRNHTNGSMKQISYLADTSSSIRRISDQECQANYSGTDCDSCGANSLHALSIGYSFIEWICDICGEKADKPLGER